MTETTPLATVGRLKRHMTEWPRIGNTKLARSKGWPAPFVELRVMRREDAAPGSPVPEGIESPWDGATAGELEIRGP